MRFTLGESGMTRKGFRCTKESHEDQDASLSSLCGTGLIPLRLKLLLQGDETPPQLPKLAI
jgi:hypothetical protein